MIYLVVYFIVMMGATLLFTERSKSVKDFLVADGEISLFKGAMSISATWMWSVALMVSSEKAYTSGIVGFLWFMVPNVFVLWLFGRYGSKMREQYSSGFSLSSFMKHKYDTKVKNLYVAFLGLITLMSTVVNLMAGGKIVSLLTGLDLKFVVAILAVTAFAYSQRSGIKASIITDVVQMVLILAVGLIVAPMVVKTGGGVDRVIDGLGGVSGKFRNLFSEDGITVALAFGIPAAISILGSPFGDNAQWQRVFSIRKDKVQTAYIAGSLIFAVAPILMGVIGFTGAGLGYVANDVGIVSVEIVKELLPRVIVVPFLYMLISGLMSTVDSNLCAISSLLADVKPNMTINQGRLAMVVLLVLASLIATVPSLSIAGLFLTYGTFRVSTFMTTVLTLNKVELTSNAVFTGVLASACVGVPVYVIGANAGIPLLQATGSLIALTLSGIVAVIYTKIEKGRIA